MVSGQASSRRHWLNRTEQQKEEKRKRDKEYDLKKRKCKKKLKQIPFTQNTYHRSPRDN
jgi:hypothetical protein